MSDTTLQQRSEGANPSHEGAGNFLTALHAGAMIGGVVGALAGLGEVLATLVGLIRAYQSGVTLGLALYAVPLYGVVGLLGGAAFGVALWVLGARARLRPLLAALQAAGWFLGLALLTLAETVVHHRTPAGALVLRGGGLLLASVVLGALCWGLERRLGRLGARRRAARLGFAAFVLGLLAVALAIDWLGALPRSTASKSLSATAPNVVLVVMDTTRADHLSAYGYGRATSPTFDELAAEGVRFETAVAPSSWTLPSVASLMTGLLPSAHGADHDYLFLDSHHVTLAEILRQRGYVTAGFVGGPYLKATFGVAQGFDTYDDALMPATMNLGLIRTGAKLLRVPALIRAERRADELNQVILPWLERHAAHPFFLFVNYFDPHDPYQPPGEYARRWASAGGHDGNLEHDRFVPRVMRRAGPPLTAELRTQLLGLYDGEIAFMDSQLKQLVGALRRLGILDRTILVLTADHGESFGEHDLILHGNALYEDQIRVPLVVRFPPRTPSGTVVATPVPILDFFPTVLDLLDIRPGVQPQGQSLLPLLTLAKPSPERTLVAELRRNPSWSDMHPRFNRNLLALRRGPWKYIASSSGMVELYNVDGDRAELDDRARREPGLVERLHREALRWMTRVDDRTPRRPIDRATRDQLKALGY